MSMMGELNYFLGLQIKQWKDEIFISQTKYLRDLLKKFGMEHCNGADTPMSSIASLDADEEDTDDLRILFNIIAKGIHFLFRIGMLVRKTGSVDRFQRALQKSEPVPAWADINHIRESSVLIRWLLVLLL